MGRCNDEVGVETDRVDERTAMAPSDKIDQLAALLEEAAETHHHVYRITDGVDDDWASWYTDWLLNLSELEQLLGARPIRSHLVHALVQLDRDHSSTDSDEPWPGYYAGHLRTQFGAPQRTAPTPRQ
jgi:hypothetical protein